jgi:hypothetical protein
MTAISLQIEIRQRLNEYVKYTRMFKQLGLIYIFYWNVLFFSINDIN